MKIYIFLMILLFKFNDCTYEIKPDKRELLIYTMASEQTDGYFRYLRSLQAYGLKAQKTFGLGLNFTGMGIKIRLFREEAEKYKNRSDVVILFTDSYDAIFNAGKEEILRAFDKLKANIVFSTETNCWPSEKLESQYPEVKNGYKYLNSGGIIGYAPHIYQMLPEYIGDKDDDQYYYSRIFLEEEFRTSLGIALDTQATIFLSLFGVEDNITMLYLENDTKIFNEYTKTSPCIVHANGFTKLTLHSLGSYLAKSWTKMKGCLACQEDRIHLERMSESKYPVVLMGVFIDRPTPFLKDKLYKISNMTYPKKKIFLFVYNRIYKYEKTVKTWMREIAGGYKGARYYWRLPDLDIEGNDGEVRAMAIQICLNISCDLYFSMDSHVNVDNPNTLNLLVSYNRTVMAPIMTEESSSKSTFWGGVTPLIKFKNTFDYQEIITNKRRGFWNVPQIFHTYVIWRFMLENPNYDLYLTSDASPDMAISVMIVTTKHYSMFLQASNLHDYGHLSNMDHVFMDKLHGDLWQASANPSDWGKNYLHPDYRKQVLTGAHPQLVCKDVYKLPLFSEKFCKEIIETMEQHRKWTGVHKKDYKLISGYKNVSTGDVMTFQIEYEKEWTSIVQNYIQILANRLFSGYYNNNTSLLTVKNHSTRYSGSYTVIVALNSYGKDFRGESSKLELNGCSYTKNLPSGWGVIFPGKIATNYHEDMTVVNDIRYSIVALIEQNST